MRASLLFLFAALAPAATLTIDPPVIYDCSGIYGQAVLRWSGASGPVQVQVGPARVPQTSLEDISGTAVTGVWVGDGLEFRLVNAQGGVEAYVAAKVRCETQFVPGNGIVGGYFPLEAGNYWVYRTDTRQATSDYMTWRVTGQKRAATYTYSEVTVSSGNTSTISMYLREDSTGVIWRLRGTEQSPSEEIFLDPRAEQHSSFTNTLGSYPDAVYRILRTSLSREDQVFVRGVGLARSRTELLSGSSGGFSSSLELIDFHLETGPRGKELAPQISLAVESTRLDVTNRRVTDCAIPCYFAACMIGGADPPGTFKPCMRVRVEASATAGEFRQELSLVNAAGQTLYSSGGPTGGGDVVRYFQVPLYSAPNQALPTGTYRLVSRVVQGSQEMASSALAIELQ